MQGPLQEASGRLPAERRAARRRASPGASGRVHAGVALAFAAALAVAWLLFRTPLGFRLRAVGHSPVAARFAGISPERHGVAALAIAGRARRRGGRLRGGRASPGGSTRGSRPGTATPRSPSRSSRACIPLAVVPSALFFGALEAGAGAMQREAGIPAVVTEIVQGVVILFSVGFALLAEARLMDALLEAALRLAAPLLLAALGELIVERAGVVNIGIEGMMLAGAFAAFAAASASGSPAVGVAAAVAAALLFGALFAAAAVLGRADQIVIGTAVNLLALGATGSRCARASRTERARRPGPPRALSSRLGGSRSGARARPCLLARTRAGLVLRAVGEAARAADAEGVLRPGRALRRRALRRGARGARGLGRSRSRSRTSSPRA